MRSLLLAPLSLLVALPAQATTMRHLSLPELVAGASVVLLGRATAQTASWREGRIVTRHTVRVEEALAGELPAGAEVVVETLGGVVGDLGQRVDGAAVLPPGAPVVLLLTPGEAGAFAVVGMSQGLFRVEAAPDGTPRLRRELAGVRLVGAAPATMPATLVELRRAIEELRRGR